MDLLATIRKEGSRGGAGDFKWSDVQASTRRENYLGHSVMAPVGRWQKGRDLNWYTKSENDAKDGEDAEARAARERKEEIRRIKEVEEDALARALGLPVPDRTNPNLQALGDRKEVDRILKESNVTNSDDVEEGLGFKHGRPGAQQGEKVVRERIEGNAEAQDKELQYALKEYRRRHTDDQHPRNRSRSRSRSRSPHRHRSNRHHNEHRERHERDLDRRGHGHRNRDRDSHRHSHARQRSKSRSPRREHRRRHARSQSPRERRRSPVSRHR